MLAKSGMRLIRGGMWIIRNRIINRIDDLTRLAYLNRAYYLDRNALKKSKLPAADYLKICSDFEALGLTIVPYEKMYTILTSGSREFNFPHFMLRAGGNCL